MNILHLVAGNLSGGAARGAHWLHRGLRELGVESFMLNNSRMNLSDKAVTSLADTSLQKAKFLLLSRIGSLPKKFYPKRKPWIFNTGFDGVDFTHHPAYRSADIIHLHWINGLVAMRTLRKVKKPVVWTMRDMWPLTGGCHYTMDCERYILGCGGCPQLGSNFKWDLSSVVVSNKKESLPKDLRLVGISHWLSDCARNSAVFRGVQIQTISNNIDTSKFYPIETSVAREVLGLPHNKKIVLIGAQSVTDFYKGFDLFIDAMNELQQDDIQILIFGRVGHYEESALPNPMIKLGFLSDFISLRIAYSAADVFVAPSRMDAFGKTIVESMACGTPVVCFDSTGPADIVDHKVTGYKAKPFEVIDLANGINWVLTQNEVESKYLRLASRNRAVTDFDSEVIAAQYVELYKELLGVN